MRKYSKDCWLPPEFFFLSYKNFRKIIHKKFCASRFLYSANLIWVCLLSKIFKMFSNKFDWGHKRRLKNDSLKFQSDQTFNCCYFLLRSDSVLWQWLGDNIIKLFFPSSLTLRQTRKSVCPSNTFQPSTMFLVNARDRNHNSSFSEWAQ